MKRPDLAIAGFGVAAGIGATAVALSSTRQETPPGLLLLLVGWSFIASGLVLRRERSDNRLGAVLVFIGFAWFATVVADSGNPYAYTFGTAVENVYLVAFIYLVLAFPGGRLTRTVDRVLFAGAAAVGIGLELLWLVLGSSKVVCSRGCPRNVLQIASHEGIARAVLDTERAVGIVLCGVSIVLLVWRLRRSSGRGRSAAAPMVWTGAAVLAALAVSIANDAAGSPLGDVPGWVLALVFAAVPVAVLASLLQQRLGRAAVADLVVDLGHERRAGGLTAALRRALGDPTLEIAYWNEQKGSYIDGGGVPVELPAAESGRVATLIERDGHSVAAIVHDAAAADDPDLVASVSAAAGLALENERLQAELRARLEELGASRARLVRASETERRRIERDLHDGAQQRLVSVALTLGLAASRAQHDPDRAWELVSEARRDLASALDELRDLSQGIHPGVLTERGLGAALADLQRRAGLPTRVEAALNGALPPHVEAAAYFVASEGLANVAKHAHANEARVLASYAQGTLLVEVADDGIGGAHAGRGSGLRGLSDRVEAVGGHLTVTSSAGRGTVVRAEIPCA